MYIDNRQVLKNVLNLLLCVASKVPILTEVLDTALSKVQWSPNGQLLAVGDIEGTIHIYEAGEVSLLLFLVVYCAAVTRNENYCVGIN